MNMKRFKIRSQHDLEAAVETFGFLPYFRNDIPGFSIEEHIAPNLWFSDEDGAWEWKGPVIQNTGCAYGKFFAGKAAYISREWFPDFANYRRDGYDFDARYDEGLARHSDKVLYDLIDRHAPIISKDLKKMGDYRKGGNKGFDSAIIRLQAQCYVITSNFLYMTDKFGCPYGWGVAEYATPEIFMGEDFTEHIYQREPEESYARLLSHFKVLLPDASEALIKRMLK